VVVPVAGHTVGCQRVAARNCLPVKRLGIKFLFVRVARAALYRCRLVVRQIFFFQVGMAAPAPEAAMYGSRKFLPVHVQRNRFAGSRCAHALLAVARETFRPGLVGGAYGAFRKQKGENRGEERRDDNSQTSAQLWFQPCQIFDNAYFMPRSVSTFGFFSCTASRLWHALQSLVMVLPSALV